MKQKGLSGQIILFNNRLCVRRGFRLSPANKRSIERAPYKKSETLHEAIKSYFNGIIIKGIDLSEIRILSKKISPCTKITGLWIEIENDSKIKDLTARGFSYQQVINHVLELYFNNSNL